VWSQHPESDDMIDCRRATAARHKGDWRSW
jgi:hypothetical protein